MRSSFNIDLNRRRRQQEQVNKIRNKNVKFLFFIVNEACFACFWKRKPALQQKKGFE